MAQQTDTRRSRYVWVTTDAASVDHAVTDEAMAAGMANRHGEYRAVCGKRFHPAPLICPPAPACPQCVAILHIREQPTAATRAEQRARHRRRRKAPRRAR